MTAARTDTLPGLPDRLRGGHGGRAAPPPPWSRPRPTLVPGAAGQRPGHASRCRRRAASAVTAGLSGEVSGDVVLVLSADVVEALNNSPVGKMDVAAALRPALEAAAATLGRVRDRLRAGRGAGRRAGRAARQGHVRRRPAAGRRRAPGHLRPAGHRCPTPREPARQPRPAAARGHGGHRRDRPHPHDRAGTALAAPRRGRRARPRRQRAGRPAGQRHADRPRRGRRRRRGLRPADQRDRHRRRAPSSGRPRA